MDDEDDDGVCFEEMDVRSSEDDVSTRFQLVLSCCAL